MARSWSGLLRRRRDGRYDLRMDDHEREVLRLLLGQFREVLATGGNPDATWRLFPTAYPDDPEKDAGYRVLAHDELLAKQLSTVEEVEQTLGETILTGDQVESWMRAVNGLRLTLGTILDVGEDDPPPDPAAPTYEARQLYEYLGYVLSELIHSRNPS